MLPFLRPFNPNIEKTILHLYFKYTNLNALFMDTFNSSVKTISEYQFKKYNTKVKEVCTLGNAIFLNVIYVVAN